MAPVPAHADGRLTQVTVVPPFLVVRSRSGVIANAELSGRPITLGRAETCDIVLPHDAEVSREHAQVWVDEQGRVLVADNGSKNGTRVDSGAPFFNTVRPATRSIRIGEFEIDLVGTGPVLHESQLNLSVELPVDPNHTRFFPSSRRLDLNQQRLTLLMNLAERISGAFEPKQLLEQALDACCEALGFERGLIVLKTPRGEPELPVTRGLRADAGGLPVSRTLINRALVDGERAVVNNPAVDLANVMTESLVRNPICSALCVPIMHRDRILGVIYGDRVTRGSTYTPVDVDFLAAIARQVGLGLENLRLFQAYVAGEKVQAELRQARLIQRGLLPSGPLAVGRFVLAGYNEPSEAVGGDYFDYFELGSQRLGVIIADVTGHGLPAALVAANLQAAVRVALTVDVPLGDVAAALNRLVVTNTAANVFITAIVGRVDVAHGMLEYVNAGHPAPLLLRGGRVDPQAEGLSLPFGIEPNERYAVERLELGADVDGVLFFTDGLTEAADAAGRLLNLEPVKAALAGLPLRSPDAMLAAMLKLVHEHLDDRRNADDLTLLALGCRA